MRVAPSALWFSGIAALATLLSACGGSTLVAPTPRLGTPTPVASVTLAPSPGGSASASPTASPIGSASAGPTASPTQLPTILPTPSLIPTLGPTPSPTPSHSPSPTPSPSPSPTPTGTPAFVDWPTYQFDSARDGFNPDTAGITPASIGHLHLAWQASMDGAAGQPIVATNVGNHTALVIVPGYKTIQAFDALSGAAVWSTSLPQQNQQQCGTGGLSGTAQYDAALGAIFVAAGNGSAPNHVVLYELNAATGVKLNQVDLTPSLVNGEDAYGHTAITFANGLLYAGTSSNCEGPSTNPNWLGRVVAVNPATMTVANTFFTTYGQGGNYGGGGVWAWGGVSADASGNVYVSSGNAETNGIIQGTPPAPVQTTTNEQVGYAEHLVKLTSNMSTVEASDLPSFNFAVGFSDLDFTGVPVLFQPPVASGCTDLLSATQGKGGLLVINDTTNLSEVATYALSIPSGLAYYMGNTGYSPNTGYLYAAITSSGNGSSMLPPGMAAINACGNSTAWTAQFGPDSSAWGNTVNPRSAPTVTAGGVVFMATPCTANSSNTGCTTPSATNGALWAVNASSGTLLGSNGNPLLVTPDDIRMAPSADGLWLWVVDNSGNLYGMTVDPSVMAVARRPGIHRRRPFIIRGG